MRHLFLIQHSLIIFSNYFEAMFIFWKVISRKLFFKLYCIYLPLEKLVNRKHFSVKGKFDLVSRKVFSCKICRKHFPEVVKKLEMSYYLLIISNLVLKLLIAQIYIYIYIYIYISISSLKI